jgi:flagellar basal-body rod protein FlgC
LKSLDISASGLTAQRMRMDVISQNIANQYTTRTATGDPYRRRAVVFRANNEESRFSSYLKKEFNKANGGVIVSEVVEDNSEFKVVYNPEHPDADEQGYVRLPNVDTLKEMIDMISATRSYESNITALNASKNMALKALEIGR